MSKITFENKVTKEVSTEEDIYKITANNLNEIKQVVNENADIVGSDTYNNASTYEIGQYCIYNNVLYRCTTAVTEAMEFNSGYWTQTSIAEILSGNNKSIYLDGTKILWSE